MESKFAGSPAPWERISDMYQNTHPIPADLAGIADPVGGNAINRALGALWPLMGCSLLIIDRH